LGRPKQRWQTAYLKNSVDTLSDRNLKKNIKISPLGLQFVESLKPVKYDFKDDNTTHYGLIAQEVSQSLAEFGVHTDDFGGYNGSEGYLSLRYEEFISPMIKAIQDQQQLIKDLQSRIETLESGSTN
jgi:flagellar capping protein FliD